MVLDTLTAVGATLEMAAIAVVAWYLKKHWKAINEDEFTRAREAVREAAVAVRRERKKDKRRAAGGDGGAVAVVMSPETAAALDAPVAPAFDYRPLVTMCVVAISLTLQQYFGHSDTYERLFRDYTDARYYPLGSFAWWSGWRVLGYVVLPLFPILIMRERLADYGLALRGQMKHLWIYVVLFLLVLPAVIVASFTAPFQHTYPFYKCAGRSAFDFVAWELLYAAQFVSLEFFFRGYMLQSLKRTMGAYAIFVMIVPYCMIHYGKPLLETMGAILAGLILGTLALRTGSIWCGALIHISVAITMDVLALVHTGWRVWNRCGM
ncbi:MAG TPA: type II CAAX endopeptidase family protein [Polyangia bacterium]|jgi:membrane protease YdiL (CAAX protease family)